MPEEPSSFTSSREKGTAGQASPRKTSLIASMLGPIHPACLPSPRLTEFASEARAQTNARISLDTPR